MVESPPLPLDGRILYFARDRAQFRFLSHFYPSPVDLDGEIWPTVEHFYQAQKSDHPDYRAAIRAAGTPGLAKRLAAPPDLPRRIAQNSRFRKHKISPRADWYVVKLDLMRRADWAKFSQHPELATLLLGTGSVERRALSRPRSSIPRNRLQLDPFGDRLVKSSATLRGEI